MKLCLSRLFFYANKLNQFCEKHKMFLIMLVFINYNFKILRFNVLNFRSFVKQFFLKIERKKQKNTSHGKQ